MDFLSIPKETFIYTNIQKWYMTCAFVRNKKGQESSTSASSAAILILLITFAIVAYILFLPPQDRENLLDGGIPGNPSGIGTDSSFLGTSFLQASPGKVNYVKDGEIEHNLASFRIYTATDAQIVTELSSMTVKNSAFDVKNKQIDFSLNTEITNNLFLSFNVLKSTGNMEIYLNGIQIFEGEFTEGSPTPIPLNKNDLKSQNILFFKATSPGFAFWRVNEYYLSNVRIVGDVTNNENSFHTQNFYLSESEFKNFEEATLKFYPDCDVNDVNKISIKINNRQIYEGLPDCGLNNFVKLGESIIKNGENSIEFTSNKGSYIIDNARIDVNLEKPDYPIYYFNLDDELFTENSGDDTYCGKIDGICLEGCESYEDKDCCFSESRKNYWCDVRTNNPRDRCVNIYLAGFDERCPSGYEDKSGKPHEDFEGKCGDDTDDYCAPGCSKLFDKDCCWDTNNGGNPENFWCEDVPLTGMDNVCTPIVTLSDCDSCPNRYFNEDHQTPNCPGSIDIPDGEEKLKSDVDVVLTADFVDKSYKKVDFVVNGRDFPVDTYHLHYATIIDDYVRSGTNSIQIKPRSDVNIAQIKVKIE